MEMICIHQGPWRTKKSLFGNAKSIDFGPKYLEVVTVRQCPDFSEGFEVLGYLRDPGGIRIAFEKIHFVEPDDISELTEILEQQPQLQ